MDIQQLIGETTDYDKKLALEEKKPKSWCKSISAFANCFGGKLIFCVSNDNELVGLADAEGDAEKISEAIKIHLNPIPEFKLSFEKDGDKTFVIVELMKGQQTPYYYEGDGQLVAFMRIGNESVPATPSQLRELVLRGSGESYDSLKSRYDFDNMSFTKLKSVYKQRTGNTSVRMCSLHFSVWKSNSSAKRCAFVRIANPEGTDFLITESSFWHLIFLPLIRVAGFRSIL